jgi:2-hydroxychromene-2-carboxylate isomerase
MGRSDDVVRRLPMREVVFWFGYNSPYSMLAHHRIETLLKGHDIRIRYRPWFTGVHLPDYDSPKVQYVVEDVIRLARAYGLALRPGSYVDLGAACRGFLMAREQGCARVYNEGIHRARWFEARDISDPDVLRSIAAGCGLEKGTFEEALAGGRVADAKETELEDARAAGVFGHPFLMFEGQKFWGNDRLEWLLEAITQAAPAPLADAVRS